MMSGTGGYQHGLTPQITDSEFWSDVLNFKRGLGSPKAIPNLAAWYDVSDLGSLVYDGSNRVSLLADKSGNSGVNLLVLDGSAGNTVSSPDSAALSISGDIVLAANVQPADWTPSAANFVVAKRLDAGNQRSYHLDIGSTGVLNARFSSNGSSNAGELASSSVATGFTDGTRHWVAVSRSGTEVKFWTSEDGATWSQLGTTQTITTVSIFDSTAILTIGSDAAGGATFSGKIYRAIVYSGIPAAFGGAGGTVAFDANFALPAKLAGSFTESSANAATVTVTTSGATGARICGERDLYQGTVANQPVLLQWAGQNYGYTPGLAGCYFSTPDSAALTVTDLDLRVWANPIDWTPASQFNWLTKWGGGGAGTEVSWRFSQNTDGTLALVTSADGSNNTVTATSSAAVPFSDGTAGWVRATMDVDNGAAGNTVTFYTSTDGVTWTQLGTPVVTGGTTSIYNSAAVVMLGARDTGNAGNSQAKWLRAQVMASIGGAAVIDFDASRYQSGSTFVASTGETWTLNGGATIATRTGLYFDGSNDYLKAAPFSLSQPETVYFVGKQVLWANGNTILDGNSAASVLLQMFGTSQQIRLYAGASLANITPSAGSNFLAAFVANGASSAIRLLRNALVAGDAGSQTAGGLAVGARGDGTQAGNITASEIAIYAAAHNAVTQSQVINYGMAKWGIS